METQTDGIEWVLGVLFGIGLIAVLIAAAIEFKKLRAGDIGGDAKKASERGDRSGEDVSNKRS